MHQEERRDLFSLLLLLRLLEAQVKVKKETDVNEVVMRRESVRTVAVGREGSASEHRPSGRRRDLIRTNKRVRYTSHFKGFNTAPREKS